MFSESSNLRLKPLWPHDLQTKTSKPCLAADPGEFGLDRPAGAASIRVLVIMPVNRCGEKVLESP